jgi:hypothetical protein
LEDDCIAEPFQPALEVGCRTGLVELVEIRFSQITVCQPFGELVIGSVEDLMGDGECCPQSAAPGL